jgi:hypothetical protein
MFCRKIQIFALTLVSFSILVIHGVEVAGSTHNGEPVGNQLQNVLYDIRSGMVATCY